MNLDVLKDAYEQAIRKELINSKAIGAAFPHAAPGGQYNREAPPVLDRGILGRHPLAGLQEDKGSRGL